MRILMITGLFILCFTARGFAQQRTVSTGALINKKKVVDRKMDSLKNVARRQIQVVEELSLKLIRLKQSQVTHTDTEEEIKKTDKQLTEQQQLFDSQLAMPDSLTGRQLYW